MTTFQEKTLTCPVCSSDVRAFEITSTNQMGQDTDFCPRTAGFHAVPLVISACRSCGYAGYASVFEERELSSDQKAAFHEARIPDVLIPLEARLNDIRSDHAYLLAAATARHFREPYEDVANLLLRASWCLRIDGRSGDAVAAHKYRSEAISEFIRAFDVPDAEPEHRRAWTYFVAELSRREGDFPAAAVWFSRFIDDPPAEREWVEAAKTLLSRANAGDASNLGFEDLGNRA